MKVISVICAMIFFLSVSCFKIRCNKKKNSIGKALKMATAHFLN